jgi:hypothetical protein
VSKLRVASITYCSFARFAGLCLIGAAILKGYAIAYVGQAQPGVLNSLNLSVPFVVCEFLLGLWLITGLYQRVTRRVALIWFFALGQVAFFQALEGKRSCECFGTISVNPWWALTLDVGLFIGLLVLRPVAPDATLATCGARFWTFIVLATSVVLPAILTMTVYKRYNKPLTELRHDEKLHQMIDVRLGDARPADFVLAVQNQTGVALSVDGTVHDIFATYRPEMSGVTNRAIRGWAVLERLSKSMPVPARWRKDRGGYTLLADSPLSNAKHAWITSFVLAGACLIGLTWRAARRRTSIPPVPDGGLP